MHGDAEKLTQVLLNLVLNAVQAMPGGGAVTVTTAYDANTVKVTVTDTGPGLSPEVQEHLFDVRVTTKPAGTGLGLPLARMIADPGGRADMAAAAHKRLVEKFGMDAGIDLLVARLRNALA